MSEKPEKKKHASEEMAETSSDHRFRMRHDWDNLIEDLIQEGLERGAFDNLPGRGKPLNLRKNLYEAEMELANTLLKKNDLRPPWITHRLQIAAKIDALRSDIQRTWARHGQAFRLGRGDAQRSSLTLSWDDACRRWEAEIVKLNREIDDFNLRRPSDRLELFKLRFDEELARVGAPRWLK